MKSIVLALILIPSTLLCQWTQVGNNINGDNADDRMGKGVALSGDGSRIVVGAYYNDTNGTDAGQVKVFDQIDGEWTQIGSTILGESFEDYTGVEVAISDDGSIIAIGSMGYDPNITGRVSIYKEENGQWNLMGNHIEGYPDSFFGQQLEISGDGNTLIVAGSSATGGGSVNSGLVQVYTYNGTSWEQKGDDFWGEGTADFMGSYVAINASGDRIAMSAPMYIGIAGFNVGRVYLYEWVNNTWEALGQILEGEFQLQELGRGIALDGEGIRLAAGSAYLNDGTGMVQVYQLEDDTWSLYGQDLPGAEEGDLFGARVSLNSNGDRLAVSAPFNSDGGFIRGTISVYEDQNGTWTLLGDPIYGEADEDRSGIALDISDEGAHIAIGSLYFDGPGGLDSGHARVFTSPILSSPTAASFKLNLFPNPTSGPLKLMLEETHANIDLAITDLSGKLVLSHSYSNQSVLDLDISFLSSGMYLVSIRSEETVYQSKLIKI